MTRWGLWRTNDGGGTWDDVYPVEADDGYGRVRNIFAGSYNEIWALGAESEGWDGAGYYNGSEWSIVDLPGWGVGARANFMTKVEGEYFIYGLKEGGDPIIWTTIPEPHSLGLILLGLGAVALRRRLHFRC